MRAIWRNEDHVLQILLLPEIRVPEKKTGVHLRKRSDLINEQGSGWAISISGRNNNVLAVCATALPFSAQRHAGSGSGADDCRFWRFEECGAAFTGLPVRLVWSGPPREVFPEKERCD